MPLPRLICSMGAGNVILWAISPAVDNGRFQMASHLAKVFTWTIALTVAAASAPASAYSCNDIEASELEARASQYDQVYAGLIIRTERSSEPRESLPIQASSPVLGPPYWVKSKVLVLRVWKGTPPYVAEIWTPAGWGSYLAPIPASYFVALAKDEAGRTVANYSDCEGPLRAYATRGSATFTPAGYGVLAVILGLAYFAFALLRKMAGEKGRQR